MALKKRIREARLTKRLTQEKLAKLIGISTTYLGEIERGKKQPGLDCLIKIAEALDVSIDYLLRDQLNSGKVYVFNDITAKLEKLTPSHRSVIIAIIDAYVQKLRGENGNDDACSKQK